MSADRETVFGQVRGALGRNRSTVYKLLSYLVLVGLGSVFAIDLLSFAWANRPWGIVRWLFRWTIEFAGIDSTAIYYLPSGILVGLMSVLLLDSYKRTQGIILWLGIVLGSVFVLLTKGLLIEPLIEGFTVVTGAFGVIGAAVGLRLGGVTISRLRQRDGELEFPEAPRRLFVVVLIMLLYGVVEAVLAYFIGLVWTSNGLLVKTVRFDGFVLNAEILLNTVMSGLGLYGLYKFTSYENHTRMILIGPQRSGKSALFGGMQLAVRDVIDDRAGIKSNSSVTRLSDDIATGEFPDATDRDEMKPLEINYRSGGLFPKKNTIQSVDYAGELLSEVLEPVIEDRARTDGGQQQSASDPDDDDDGPSLSELVGGDEEDEGRDVDEPSVTSWEEATERLYDVDYDDAGEAIWDCIAYADRVIMTLPMDDFVTPIVDRGNWPSYQPIETFDGDLTIQEIREQYDIPLGVNLQSYQDGYYYYADEPDRSPPAEYISWYRDLAREFHGDKEFVLIGTMADWVTKDFEREHPRGLNPRIRRNYPEFCRYAYEQVMLQANVNVQDLFAATSDDRVHFLWYPIENTQPPEDGEEYRIDTNKFNAVQNTQQTLLNGARQLIERLNR